MSIRLGALTSLLAAFQCGTAPATPGESTTTTAVDTDPITRTLGPQPNSVCDLDWTPSPEPDLLSAEQLVARGDHACARISSGRVRCWGSNEFGQLATCEDAASHAVPQQFPGIEQALDVGVGRFGTCVVEAGGTLACSDHIRRLFGVRGPGWLEGIDDAQRVAVGDLHACVVTRADRVLCFGHWDADEVLGPRADIVGEGEQEGRGAGFVDVVQTRDIVAGSFHNCTVDRQGQVMCWGQNTQGQLGDPAAGEELEQNRGVPRRVAGLPFIQSLQANRDTTCAVSDGGELFCWGQGFGPRALRVGLPAAVRVGLGAGFVCAATPAGTVTCGGENTTFAAPGSTASLPGFDHIEDIVAGNDFICARRSDGMVLCQGSNDRGQLGGQHADEARVLRPIKVLLGGVAI